MEFCYGEKNHIRILEEAGFWKRQEAEHTVVIRAVADDLESEYVDKLNEYHKILSSSEGAIVKHFETLNKTCYELTPEMIKKINDMISVTASQSQVFVNFLTMLLGKSTAVKNSTFLQRLLNHMIRESEYYLGIADAYFNLEGCK